MDRPDDAGTGAVIRVMPRQELLDPVQSAAFLGLTPGLFRALRLFRCGPAMLKIRSRPFFRRSELERLRVEWCKAVRVRGEDRLAALSHDEVDDNERGQCMEWQEKNTAGSELDPLMRLLALRAIRHRIVVSIFWMMAIVGGAICLTLY